MQLGIIITILSSFSLLRRRVEEVYFISNNRNILSSILTECRRKDYYTQHSLVYKENTNN